MKVTIIRADGFVSVDGRGFAGLDLAFMPADVRAVQWNGDAGEVEHASGQATYIKSLSPFQPALAAWAAAKLAADGAEVDVSEATVMRESKRAALAALRYTVETGGITVGSAVVKTDPESQMKVAGAFVAITGGLIPDVEWKGTNGWQTLTGVEIGAVAQAVAAHVRKTYATERAVWEQIGELADADIEAFDVSAAWAATWGVDVATQALSNAG